MDYPFLPPESIRPSPNLALNGSGRSAWLLNLISGIFTLKAHTMHWNAAEGKCLQLRGSIRSKEANLFPHRE